MLTVAQMHGNPAGEGIGAILVSLLLIAGFGLYFYLLDRERDRR